MATETSKHETQPQTKKNTEILDIQRPIGRQQGCITTSLSKMITNGLELKDNLNNWMTTDKTTWQSRITEIAASTVVNNIGT